MGTQPNFETSALYIGDNLDFMRGMDSGSVNLIATDPPFNKGVKAFKAKDGSAADGAAFIDKWDWQKDAHPIWTEKIREEWPAVDAVVNAAKEAQGYDTAAFLCWLGVRLIEMHRILADDGSIYVHCDHTAGAWIRALMDAIFGRENFRNEIVWQRYGSHNDAKRYAAVSDTVMYYARSGGVWNPQYSPLAPDKIDTYYRMSDARGRFTTSPLQARSLQGGGYSYEWQGVKDTWKFPRERLDELDADGRIYWPPRGSVPRRKVYLADSKGVPLANVMTDISIASGNERLGWPTQKPVALYERFVLASSNEGDVVFDPFAGCSTTLVAAEKHGRRWIGCDRDPMAQTVVRDRLSDSRQLSNPVDVQMLYKPPVRTDEQDAVPDLVLKPVKPRERTLPRAELLDALTLRDGMLCQGCGLRPSADVFPPAAFKRLMEVDHNHPRSAGGSNQVDNRVLLCGGCNRAKSDTLTLKGLRRHNKANGLMVNEKGLA